MPLRLSSRAVTVFGAGALGSVMVLAGCASPGNFSTVPTAKKDVVGSWEFVEGRTGGSPIPRPDGGRATLVIEQDTLSGTAFCNSYGSRYRLPRGGLSLTGLGGTDMLCEPELMEAETVYLKALVAADERVGVENGQLVISGDGVQLRFRRLSPVPKGDIVGIHWVLETLLRGDVATAAAGQSAVLELDHEGTFYGSTGCRSLSGTWLVHGDEIVFPTMGAKGDCPSGLRDQDDHVVGVLGDGFQADVEGDKLTVTDADGSGLVYGRVQPVAPEAADLHLWVSNQSFDDAQVQITVSVDGVEVVDAPFEVADQHNWQLFPVRLDPGQHVLRAVSDSGAEVERSIVIPRGAQRYVVVNYWSQSDELPGRFTVDISDEPVAFA